MVSHVSWPRCCLRHAQYPVAVVACVLSDNCLLEAPGAFSIATYTPRWCVFDGPPVASVYLCAPQRCRLSFVGIVFVFGQPPVTLPCFQQVPWGCAVCCGSVTVFLHIVLFYSFSCFECLLMPFSFFFVFFIRLSFRLFHFRCLASLNDLRETSFSDRPDFQITVHSHCFESSRNQWRSQKGLHEMEEFYFFRRRS